MNFSKRLFAGLFAAISVFGMLSAEAAGTQVYQYQAEDVVAAGTLNGAAYGLTKGDNVYGAGKTNKLGKDLFYWYSTKGANTGFTRAVTVQLANNTQTEEILDAGNAVVQYEFIFALYATISKEGQEGVRFEFNASDVQETQSYKMLDMAIRRNGSAGQGLFYVVGQEALGVDFTTANGKEPAQFAKLKLLLNMEKHTYCVTYTPLKTDAQTLAGEEKTMAKDILFRAGEGIKLKPQQMSVYVRYNGSGEAIYPVSIQTTVLAGMGNQAVKITPETGSKGNAVGFYAQETTDGNTARRYGFKLTAPGKEAWFRMNKNQPVITGEAQVRYGVILEDDTGLVDLTDVSAQVYYTEAEE